MRVNRAAALLLLLVASATATADLKLDGEARRDHFCKVTSDQSGKWIVLGPDVLKLDETLRLAPNLSVGEITINRRETIVLDDGKTCYWVGPPGVYAVIQVVDSEEEPSFLVVKIPGKVNPKPDPDDPPPDDPEEVPPDRFDNVGRLSFRLASQLSGAARDQIGATAEVYETAGSRFAAGGFPSYSAASSYITTELAGVWGSQAETWDKDWKKQIGVVFARHIDPQTSNRNDIADFYEAIAAGLKGAK